VFKIRLDDEGVVFLSGRLDASQIEAAAAVLDTATGTTVADLSGLDYISSAGIAVLLKTYQRLTASGGTLKLRNLNQRITNVFYYSGLDKILTVE